MVELYRHTLNGGVELVGMSWMVELIIKLLTRKIPTKHTL
jgi:hypothetical protein